MPGLDPGIHRKNVSFKRMDCRVISAFTRVSDALCPAMAKRIDRSLFVTRGLDPRSIFFAKTFFEADGLPGQARQ
jgi:hypothetical protein